MPVQIGGFFANFSYGNDCLPSKHVKGGFALTFLFRKKTKKKNCSGLKRVRDWIILAEYEYKIAPSSLS